MKQFKQYMSRPSFLSTAVMAVLIAVVGCGDFNESPMNSFEEVDLQEVKDAPAGYLVFSQPMARMVATKKAKMTLAGGIFSHKVTKGFEFDENEKLEVEFDNYADKGEIAVKKATFSVRKNSIDLSELTTDVLLQNDGDDDDGDDDDDDEIDITMVVSSGTTLEDVVVAFGPSGLLFKPSARLDIQLTGNLKGLVAEGQGFAYHIDGAGNITKVAMEAEVKSNGCKLRIEVPGFSRYTWDD